MTTPPARTLCHSAEMPEIQPGAFYPGIDTERGGILPARGQTIKKDIMDIDVDDTRLDESVMCDPDQFFNTRCFPPPPLLCRLPAGPRPC